MNLLARIVSNGFALMVVVLIVITLMYRGDLFPEWDLPEFLVIKDKPAVRTDAVSGTVDRALPETIATSPESVPLVAPQIEVPQVEVIEEVVTQDVLSPPEEVVPDAADESPETSPDAKADELAVPETMLAAPVTDPQPEPEAAPAAETVTESEVVTEQIEPPLADTAPSMPAAEPVTDSQPESEAVAAPVTEIVTESEIVTEQIEPPLAGTVPSMPAAEAVTDPQPESVAAEAEAPAIVAVTESEIVTEQFEAPSSDMATSRPAAEPVIDPQPESVAAAATLLENTAGKSTYELLAAAREAYWLHDYDGAENHYRLLLQLEPDNPDWYGELGNLYFAQGQWQQASAVYYEAGVRLLNDGKMQQARQMVDVIRGLNGVEADDLEKQVNAGQVTP